MSEKKVIYSKRFPKESFAELGEETKQLNKESKTNDDIPEGEHIIDFLKRNRKAVPNEERIAEKDMFVRAIIDLSTTYQIDADIVEYDTYLICNLYLESSSYTGYLKKLFSGILVMADEMSIFPPTEENANYAILLSLTYHTHDIYFKGRKITDLDWED